MLPIIHENLSTKHHHRIRRNGETAPRTREKKCYCVAVLVQFPSSLSLVHAFSWYNLMCNLSARKPMMMAMAFTSLTAPMAIWKLCNLKIFSLSVARVSPSSAVKYSVLVVSVKQIWGKQRKNNANFSVKHAKIHFFCFCLAVIKKYKCDFAFFPFLYYSLTDAAIHSFVFICVLWLNCTIKLTASCF